MAAIKFRMQSTFIDKLEAVRKVLRSAISGLGDMVYLVEEPKKESPE